MSRDRLAKLDALHHLHPFADPEVMAKQARDGTGPLVMTRGEGVFLEDSEGRRYLDGMAGLWCLQVGYGRPELVEAARSQLERLSYYNTFFGTTTDTLAELVHTLRDWTPGELDWFLFGNSGSEAIDSAVRMVRHYWALAGRPGRRIVIGRELGYHGSTLAGVSAGGMARMHAQGGLPLPDFHHVMAPYAFEYADHANGEEEDLDTFGLRAADALEQKIRELGPENVAAFFAEPLQGAGGVIVPPDSYWPAVQAICRRHDVLLLADEVICGFGRTGRRFGSETFGIEPDLMTMAKGITSGYVPLSVLAIGPRVAETLRRGGVLQHGFTYSGHPVAAAVALANLAVIEEEGLVERTRTQSGPRLQQALRELEALPGVGEVVGDVRGVGLIAGVELVRDRTSRARFQPAGSAGRCAFELCLEEGLVVRSIREGLALCPALTIAEHEIDELVARLARALERLPAALAL